MEIFSQDCLLGPYPYMTVDFRFVWYHHFRLFVNMHREIQRYSKEQNKILTAKKKKKKKKKKNNKI